MSLSFTKFSDTTFVGPQATTLPSDTTFVGPQVKTYSSDTYFNTGIYLNYSSDTMFASPNMEFLSDTLFVAAPPYVPPNPPSGNGGGSGAGNGNSGQSNCQGCGAAIDCDPPDPYAYNLDNPTYGFVVNCPPGVNCSGGRTIYYGCCSHLLTAFMPQNATPAQQQAIVTALLNQCQQYAGECGQTIPTNPIYGNFLYWNQPQSYTVTCPDFLTSFTWTEPGGIYFGASQGAANSTAAAIAKTRAYQHQLCLSDLPQGICLNVGFSQTTVATTQYPQSDAVWSSSGTLPTGLTFSNGVISGTPIATGAFVFSITITLSNGDAQTKQYTVQVATITSPQGLPVPVVGTPYSYQLTTSGFSVPTFAITNGALPAGLTMSEAGLITGTATNLNSLAFTVTATEPDIDDGEPDYACSKQFNMGLTVTPDIFSNTVSNFNGGASLAPGTYKISYVQGANKYNASFGFTLNRSNGSGNPDSAYWVKYNNGAAQIEFPGTLTEFSSQALVESANAGKSITITHTGGTIGVYLVDNPYGDNVAGSPNPTFSLMKTA